MLEREKWIYKGILTLLILMGCIVGMRLLYIYLADENRFPINTVKISASFQHVSRESLERILSVYQDYSFFSFPISQLHQELLQLDFVDEARIQRIWPDVLKVKVTEKKPVAVWNNGLMTESGEVFANGFSHEDLGLVTLKGPVTQQNEVLQNYKKLSKLLLPCHLQIASLALRENLSWDLSLANGTQLLLGKQDIEKRLTRFCKVYRSTLEAKHQQLTRVDLRYERGMAIQWGQQTGR